MATMMRLFMGERVRQDLHYSLDSKRFAANSLWLLLARSSSQVLAFIFSVLVARSLGESGLGQFAFISALVFLANIITTFGTDTLLIREVAGGGRPSQGSFGAVLWLQLCLSVLFIVGFNLIAWRLPGKTPETVLSLQVFAFTLIPQAFTTVFSAVLRGQQRMDLYLLSSLFTALAQTIGAAFLLWMGGGLLMLTWMIVLVQLLSAFIAYRLCRRYLSIFHLFGKPLLDQAFLLARKSWPLALLAGLGITYQRMGILLLSFLAGDAATGWFSAAARVSEGFKIFHIALLGALFPILASLPNRDVRENPRTELGGRTNLYRNAHTFLMIYTFLIVLPVVWFAKPAVFLSFGSNFAPSSSALQVLILTLIPYTYVSLVSLDLVAKGAERLVLAGLAITMAAAVPLHIYLIPRHGLLGASWAAVGSELIQAGILFLLRRKTQIQRGAPLDQSP